jgi:hypothetical protein
MSNIFSIDDSYESNSCDRWTYLEGSAREKHHTDGGSRIRRSNAERTACSCSRFRGPVQEKFANCHAKDGSAHTAVASSFARIASRAWVTRTSTIPSIAHSTQYKEYPRAFRHTADPGPGKVHPRPYPASHSPRNPQALTHTRNRTLASGIGGLTGNRVQKGASGQWNPAGIARPGALTRSLTGFDLLALTPPKQSVEQPSSAGA